MKKGFMVGSFPDFKRCFLKLSLKFLKPIALSFSFIILFLNVNAQSRQIFGVLKNNSGETLIGVSIQVKNSTQGTQSGVDGKFKTIVPDNNIIFVFTKYLLEKYK